MTRTHPVLRVLQRAERDRSLVRLLRNTRYGDDLQGFVVATGSKWTCVADIADGGQWDGWTAVRLEHIDRVRPVKHFAADFARLQPTWPPQAPPNIVLGSTAGLLRSMQQVAPLIAIEQDDRIADAMWIGTVHDIAEKRLWLDEVDHRARRVGEAGYRLRNITSVSAGSAYLTALAEVLAAQPKPAAG